jgi:hypothetical protein
MASEEDASASQEPVRRRDPRYVEKSPDLSDWIQVRLVRQFGSPIEASGLLIDLTPRAVRVGFPDLDIPRERFEIGTRLLITFRFRDLVATTATATVARVDGLSNGIGLVLFFDFIREADRETIRVICEAFHRSENPPPAGLPEI